MFEKQDLQLINKTKLIYLPLFIMFVIIVSAVFVGVFYNRSVLLSQLQADNLGFTKQGFSLERLVNQNTLLGILIIALLISLMILWTQRKYIGRLFYLAYHDVLTGLPNRIFLMEKLEKVLDDDHSGAVIFIDLTGTKEINDMSGHIYGDKVLKSISASLKQEEDENVFISRFGGDKFMVIITGDKDLIHQKCIGIMNRIKIPVMADDYNFKVDCCMGIALFPQDGTDAEELLSKADVAMYYVKTSLLRGHAYFEHFMLDEVKLNHQIQKILRQAINNHGFKLLFQPIAEVKTGEITSFEALLRIADFNIPAVKFIEVAEEKGLIIDLGRWVVKKVISLQAEWKQKGFDIKPVAVNFSPKQIRDNGFIEYLEMLFNQYSLEPKYLEIEITENILIQDAEATITFLQKLKKMGVKVSLDDFGSGYSSLSYLTYIPVDKIKLDKTLNDKYLNEYSHNVIKYLIYLSHDLNLKVVAEGIETEKQFEILKNIECDYVQGYLLSRPVETHAVEAMLAEAKVGKLFREDQEQNYR